MRTCTSFALAFIFLSIQAGAKIKNGYETEINNSKESLKALLAMLDHAPSLLPSERRSIRMSIEHVVDYIVHYELTELLLEQFKAISPDLFSEMDSLKDKKGKDTDVYIKITSRKYSYTPLLGATFFSLHVNDEDANVSEYGEYSISVKIKVVDNVLQLLYHELGHIRYVVPNRAQYTKFYRRHYLLLDNLDPDYVGHSPLDQSGYLAKEYENRFLKDYSKYLRKGGIRLESPMSVLQKLKRTYEQLPGLA